VKNPARELVQEAIDAMEALREAAQPCEVHTHAMIPAAAFHDFVNAQASLMYRLAHLPEFPPAEVSELMLQAYRSALHVLISSTPKTSRRWPVDAKGYRIPEREKANARYKAMLEAAAIEAKEASRT
jgi:hypothetical protein